MVTAALLGWAALATLAAVIAAWRARAWRRAYQGALGLYCSLPQPQERTPHQRGAETARARRLERMRAHRTALEASMTERVNG